MEYHHVNVEICVIGGGTSGLSVATAAAHIGVTVALVEAQKMGGVCLNYGCVPCKCLFTAAKLAQDVREASQFGIQVGNDMRINFSQVMSYVHGVVAALRSNGYSVHHLMQLGIKVIRGRAKFIDPHTIVAGNNKIRAQRFIIATGSSVVLPSIPGLKQVPFYTNETIFNLKEKPKHLLVIGGGPIGCGLAQSFLMLDTKVTVLEAFKMLPRDEEDIVEILRHYLVDKGLVIHEQVEIKCVRKHEDEVEVVFKQNGEEKKLLCSHLLIATGRRANMDQLALDAAGITYSSKCIQVDKYLRTTNKNVYAIGDVAGSYQFTHVAQYQAGIVIRNVLFHLPSQVNYRMLSWVTYTDPELAHVGLSCEEAAKKYRAYKVLEWDFSHNDRALAENKTLGKIKVITTSHGKILGVTILGPSAGELLLPWINAIRDNKSIYSMANVMVPYPTLSEISKQVAEEFRSHSHAHKHHKRKNRSAVHSFH